MWLWIATFTSNPLRIQHVHLSYCHSLCFNNQLILQSYLPCICCITIIYTYLVYQSCLSCICYATGEDDVTPGSSFVFSCLEVCLSIMVRHIPAINSALVSSGIYQTSHRPNNAQEVNQAVASVLNVIDELPALCSQNGKWNINGFSAGRNKLLVHFCYLLTG